MENKLKVKAILLIGDDECYVSTSGIVCSSVLKHFNLLHKDWKKLGGKRPWKTLDEILDGIKKNAK